MIKLYFFSTVFLVILLISGRIFGRNSDSIIRDVFSPLPFSPPNDNAEDSDESLKEEEIESGGSDPFNFKNQEKNEIDWSKADHKSIMRRLEQDILTQMAGTSPESRFFMSGQNHLPIKDAEETMTVHLWIYVDRILDIDEKHQKVELLGSVNLSWNDSFIGWDPADYQNVSMITFHPINMWIPPLRCRAGMETQHEPFPTVEIKASGLCWYHSIVKLKVFCPDMDYWEWPYDTHTCNIVFYLHQASSSQMPGVHLTVGDEHSSFPAIDMVHPDLMKNISLEWHIVNVWKNETTVKVPPGNKVVWSYVDYWFQYKRHAPYHGLLCILPLIVSSVCLVLMFSFPLGNPMRIGVALGSFIFLCLVFERAFYHLPPASNTIPKIVHFYGLIFSVGLLALLETVLFERVFRLVEEARIPPPLFLQRIFGCLARFVCYCKREREEILPQNYMELEESDQGPRALLDEADRVTVQTCRPGHITWCDVIRVSDSMIFVVFLAAIVLGVLKLLI